MELLNEYSAKRQELFEYFGYVEDWRVIPVDDATQFHWQLTGESYGDEVQFALTPEELGDGGAYSNEIYTQRFLKKWVYRGADYTMIVVDTHTDGNKFLQIFDNEKEVKSMTNDIMIPREEMLRLLHEGSQTVTFTKVDGTERVMECTLHTNLIPADKQPVEPKPNADGTVKKTSTEVIRVYAFDVQEWRSFRVDSVKGFTESVI